MATQPQHLYTLEEYLDLEERAEYRSEYHAGVILAMAGWTLTHSRLSSRMNYVLERHLANCQIYDSNLKIYIEKFRRSVYADAMALCGSEPRFVGKRKDIILNPGVVVEVLSPSTEDYDRGRKSDYYRSIPSVGHILLVSQELPVVEHFARGDKETWTIRPYGTGESIPVLNVHLPVDEIYRGILK